MTETFDPASTRHMVAPEFLPALELFPKVDFTQDISNWRGPILADLMPPMPLELAAVDVEELSVPGLDGAPDVRILVYTPPQMVVAPRAALLNIHGGGYVIGRPEQNDRMNRARALDLGCQVFATSYRLAPETVFPGAVLDCFAALCWIAENAAELGIDPDRIALSGESAGGGHAAALAIHARNHRRVVHDGPEICFLLLDSPMLDDRTGSQPTPHPYTGEFTWTAVHNRFGWASLLGRTPGGIDVPAEAVPARVDDLHELPPTFIVIGSLDLFLEESLEFARRLSRAGVAIELHVIPGGFHGFGLAGPVPLVAQKHGLETAALKRAMKLA